MIESTVVLHCKFSGENILNAHLRVAVTAVAHHKTLIIMSSRIFLCALMLNSVSCTAAEPLISVKRVILVSVSYYANAFQSWTTNEVFQAIRDECRE